EKTVAVWDIKDQVTVATLTGHEGDVTALSFSENGYYLATASQDGTVKLWDLRKPLNIQTLKVSDGPVSSVKFDSTGQYLAVGADTVQIFNFETKSSLGATVELKDHSGSVTGICWGQHAKSAASVSMDPTAPCAFTRSSEGPSSSAAGLRWRVPIKTAAGARAAAAGLLRREPGVPRSEVWRGRWLGGERLVPGSSPPLSVPPSLCNSSRFCKGVLRQHAREGF
ncbi:unnamed protein product, partial [Prorocentrum cordatum]